ncbi:MAG TPA: hypothetical protein VK013_11135, partial [Myxococcaceae bacterium]|nr:hypothetical protein [Myxococcaceae bacterium]
MHRLLLVPLTVLGMLASGTAVAQPRHLSADRDTYVKENNKGPYGSEPLVTVSKGKNAKNTRKGLISFWGLNRGAPIDASLALTVERVESSGTQTVHVYGVRDAWATLSDGVGECQEDFSESALKHGHVPFLDTSADGVNEASGCLFRGRPLGTLKLTRAHVGQTVRLESPALVAFLQENVTERVTFLLVRDAGDKANGEVAFASREHPSLPRASLSWTDASDFGFPDWSTGAQVTNGGRTVHYQGTIEVPLGDGGTLRLPAASVTMGFTSSGNLETLSGTVGYPELPEEGIFGALGAFEGSGPALQVGFDYPMVFNQGAELPLNPFTRYLYVRTMTGATLSWGVISAESPGAGETLLVFDPAAPATYLYTSHLPGGVPLDSVQLGVSNRHTIPFVPLVTRGVEGELKGFNGNLHLGASGEIPTKIPGVGFAVEGEMTAKAVPEAFPAVDWVEELGGNAEAGLSATVGVFNVTVPFAEASYRYRAQGRGGLPSLAYSTDAAVPHLPDLPFQIDGKAKVWSYLAAADAGQHSFVGIKGRVKFGTRWVSQKFDMTVDIGPQQAALDGTVSFGGFKVNVSGSASQSRVRLAGSASTNWGVEGYKVKLELKVGFDSAQAP